MTLQEIVNIILAFFTLILGGTNVVQWRNNSALRRKMEAEADHTKYDAQQVVIDGLQAEVGRLQQRVEMADARYASLDSRYTELLDLTVKLRNEIAELKSKK